MPLPPQNFDAKQGIRVGKVDPSHEFALRENLKLESGPFESVRLDNKAIESSFQLTLSWGLVRETIVQQTPDKSGSRSAPTTEKREAPREIRDRRESPGERVIQGGLYTLGRLITREIKKGSRGGGDS